MNLNVDVPVMRKDESVGLFAASFLPDACARPGHAWRRSRDAKIARRTF
jgi:hypothetical protein